MHRSPAGGGAWLKMADSPASELSGQSLWFSQGSTDRALEPNREEPGSKWWTPLLLQQFRSLVIDPIVRLLASHLEVTSPQITVCTRSRSVVALTKIEAAIFEDFTLVDENRLEVIPPQMIGLTRGRRAHLTRHEEAAVLELLTLIDSRASFPNDLLMGNRRNIRALLVALNAMRMAFADLSFTGLTVNVEKMWAPTGLFSCAARNENGLSRHVLHGTDIGIWAPCI